MGIARRPKESRGCQGHRGVHESEPRKKDATGASKRKLRPTGARGGGEPKRRGQLKGAKKGMSHGRRRRMQEVRPEACWSEHLRRAARS